MVPQLGSRKWGGGAMAAFNDLQFSMNLAFGLLIINQGTEGRGVLELGSLVMAPTSKYSCNSLRAVACSTGDLGRSLCKRGFDNK